MSADSPSPQLTDFMDLATLQEIQDSFASVANVKAIITDGEGKVITQPAPTSEFLRRQSAIAQADETADGPQREGREYVAPITINNERLGTIRMVVNPSGTGVDEAKLEQLAEKFSLDARQIKSLATSLNRANNTRPAAIQFLFMLANAIAKLCYQEFQLRRKVNELTAVYNIATLSADSRDLQTLLQRTVQVVAEVANVKAASIRLIDRDNDELITKAVHNLSADYLDKGILRFSKAAIDQVALSEQGYEYVRDMGSDARVQYPEQARREGIASLLSVGMRYKGEPIGVLRLYTDSEHPFPKSTINLMKAIAAQSAAAIENARLFEESTAAIALEKQVQMASDVQQRMLPSQPPIIPGVDLASVYVPAHTLGGDFFDFIPLPYDNVGLVIADVSGKGVPASLIMSSVRAALRAQVDNVFYVYEVMKRLNVMLCRDTKPSEFVTLFYGVLDAPNRRLTYCNAGHPLPLILRRGEIQELSQSNMVLGVDCDEQYHQAVIDLEPDDTLFMYTDGLPDARNFLSESFGRQRILDAFIKGGPSADAVAQNVLWDMRRFAGFTSRTDDVTLMVAKILETKS